MSDRRAEGALADAAARASIEMWHPYVGAIPGAWVDEREEATAVVSGIPGAGFNGVWVERPGTSPALVSELLDRVAAAGVPHCLQLRAGDRTALEDVARGRGMVFDGEEPTMVLEDPSLLDAALDVPGLTIERLARDEGIVHARIAAHAFGTLVETFEAAMTPAILSVPGIKGYAGRVGDEAVTSAVGITHRGTTGIVAVGTLTPRRRRGYAAAVTARAALDGFAAGAEWVWLQADPSAVRVYERLGFRSVDTSALWVLE